MSNKNKKFPKVKMKLLVFIYLVLLASVVNAQSNVSKINGFIGDSSYKYAFLLLSDRKVLQKTPITKGKFDFEVNKLENFEMGTIYFGIDSNRTYADVIGKRNEGIQESKSIVLEDSVKIIIKDNVKEAELIGGKDTKAINAMNETIKTRKYTDFFILYPQSPITLFFLELMLRVEKKTSYKMFVDYEKIYSNLPLELQNSKRGLEVKLLLQK